MAIYKIADMLIEVSPEFGYTQKQMEDYLDTSGKEADFSVEVTREDLIKEHEFAPGLPIYYYESIAIYRKICLKLLESYNGIFFHCSALSVDGKAYIFTAPSGTGKSTHARMWREAFGDGVVMINDDKPIIRFCDGKFYVYGTPWDGKHGLSSNVRVPLHAVCLLQRGQEDRIERASGFSCLAGVLNQTIVPKERDMMDKLLDFLEKMLTEVPIYKMQCTISHDSAKTAFEAMK